VSQQNAKETLQKTDGYTLLVRLVLLPGFSVGIHLQRIL
jgi:hypothetical protein